jgi:hypothetical protein
MMMGVTAESSDVLLVVLGAGASFDSMPRDRETEERVDLAGVGTYRFDQVRPPLTKDLAKEQPFFNSLVSKYPACRPVVDYLRRELVAASARPTPTLEDALARYQAGTDASIPRQMMATRFYLRDLLWTSTGFMQSDILTGGITNYTTLIRKLRAATVGTPTHLCIVSFNYDLLLEATCRDHWGFDPNVIEAYLGEDVSILKPHGSVQWVWFAGGEAKYRPTEADRQTIELAPDVPADSSAEILQGLPPYDRDYDSFTVPLRVPALALPIAEKTDFAWPKAQQDRLCSFTGAVHRVLTIGWRAAEPHFVRLLEPLVARGAKLLVVTGRGDTDETVANLVSVTGEAAHICALDTGFRDFLGREEFDWLLGSDNRPPPP